MKKYILHSIPFILVFCCIVAFNLIGSTVQPDGMLVEPFFLIPIAWLLFLVGIIGLIGRGIFTIFKLYKRL